VLRSEVNQRLLSHFTEACYLEIGVDQGASFKEIRAFKKVGVDPKFAFDYKNEAADPGVEFHEVTSDIYFTTIKKSSELFDVIFIDGLHTYDQCLRDLLNAISSLKPGGYIVVDDVIPSSYAASLPDLELMRRYISAINSTDGSWMGDVYRVVLFVQSFMPLFSYATVTENHGQMVIWKEARSVPQPAHRTVESVCRAEYIETILSPEQFHLKPFDEIEAHLLSLRAQT
jgi:hypothetical protein